MRDEAVKRQLVLNIPTELRAWLELVARDQSRSLNYVATQVLEAARRSEERQHQCTTP